MTGVRGLGLRNFFDRAALGLRVHGVRMESPTLAAGRQVEA